MAQTGLDETLKLEAVYLTGPVPRNLGVLTVLGAVFDKVYFPGVHMPKSGYDPKEVEKEIVRLEGLNDRWHDTQLLIGAMKLLLQAKTLDGFCEFTADPDDPFLRKDPVPGQLVQAVYDSIHGPPRPDFIPSFSTGTPKGSATVLKRSFIPATTTTLPEPSCIPDESECLSLMTFPACRSRACQTSRR